MITYDQAAEKLLILETLGLAKDVEKATVRAWVSLMNAQDVTPKEWGAAISKVAQTKTFQVKPAEVLEVVKDIRDAARVFALNTVDHVEAIDDRGYLVLTHYARVQDGRLLPGGRTNPSALPPSKVAALTSSTLTLAQREERIRDMVKRSGVVAAVAFVNMLRGQGVDAKVESDALRVVKEEVERADREQAEKLAAEQAARIRKQVAAIKGELVN